MSKVEKIIFKDINCLLNKYIFETAEKQRWYFCHILQTGWFIVGIETVTFQPSPTVADTDVKIKWKRTKKPTIICIANEKGGVAYGAGWPDSLSRHR